MNKKILLHVSDYIDYIYDTRKMIILNISIHNDELNTMCIIHHSIRNKISNKLHNCLNTLNKTLILCKTIYSNFTNLTFSEKDIEYLCSLSTNAFIYYMITVDNKLTQELLKYFKDIDTNIFECMSSIGSKSIRDIFLLYYGNNYNDILNINNNIQKLENNNFSIIEDINLNIFNNNALLELLCDYFVPVEINNKLICKDNKTIEITKNIINYDEKITEEDDNYKFELLLENNYKIILKIKENIFVIIGYFKYDVLNILSSKYNFIESKKKLLYEYTRDNVLINKEYRDFYLNNMNIGDILTFNENDINKSLTEYYELFVKHSNAKFKDTINIFIKENILNKFKMIKSLLLGNKNSIKYGSFLFGTTRDQNKTVKNNNAYVSDIIFRNLNNVLQNKLRKTGQCIRQELERIKNISLDDMDLKQQCILNNNINSYVKKCILNKLDEMKSNNGEHHKNLLYVKTLIDFPWIPKEYCDIFGNISTNMVKCREKLKQIKDDLDVKVFGQTEFKTVIGDIVGKWLTNPQSIGKAIGLCGPPGCGKTLIASGLGDVLKIPYQEIHLGGLEDGSVLNGHSFTYSGAQPGLIVTKMVMAGSPRCILFFDELDKACSKHGVNEIFNVLIHATDPNTNSKFSDKFFQDVTFQLNKCIFIFSFNDASKIDPILKDRMEIIQVSPYSMNDKLLITKNYLMPELLKGINIENGSVSIKDELITYIIDNYTLEAGVRKLKNCIEKIFLKMNIDRINNTGVFKNKTNFSKTKPITLNKNNIETYLGKPKNVVEKIQQTPQIGVINGLYATTIGSGGILPILCYPARNNDENFKLELTGKHGDVMKESIAFSWTIAKNCVKPEILNEFYKNNNGLHVHTPDGATEKDGPSAGGAFVSAFISRLTNYPIKKDIAMTGEISVNALLTAIGGLEYKLNGAKIAGIKLVFVSIQNLEDVKKIKEANPNLFELINPWNNNKVKLLINSFKKNKLNNSCDFFKIIVVENIFEIIPYILIDNNKKDFSTYEITCDISKFMCKNNNNGFNNNIE